LVKHIVGTGPRTPRWTATIAQTTDPPLPVADRRHPRSPSGKPRESPRRARSEPSRRDERMLTQLHGADDVPIRQALSSGPWALFGERPRGDQREAFRQSFAVLASRVEEDPAAKRAAPHEEKSMSSRPVMAGQLVVRSPSPGEGHTIPVWEPQIVRCGVRGGGWPWNLAASPAHALVTDPLDG